ncbi:MAG: tRNA (guanosine(37)-N1)-methyltransferase TrmD [Spirochaetes bacterium]|nr:tRNA (guanosine(37)-N1)-methyltransferase TrmD [Spirochaetota bacterium]
MKNFKVITLFPDFFNSPLQSSLLGKAVQNGIIETEIIDLREYSDDRLKRCDDSPYGGGSGMVIKPEPVYNCLEKNLTDETKVIYLTPSGIPFNQELVKKFSSFNSICMICGHYEGIDQRVIDEFVDYEISAGDYILSGGEIAALILIDSISRYETGFMSNEESLNEESFENNLLEYPHYTRPVEYRGQKVPDVLLSGNHARISEWRLEKSIQKTMKVRPDLYEKYKKQ